MKNPPVELRRPGWTEAVLVCRDCRERSNGPRGMKRKAVLAALRDALPAAKPRPRVVACSCLGPCPKGALTIAFVGAGGGPRYLAVAALSQIGPAVGTAVAAALLGPVATTTAPAATAAVTAATAPASE